LAFDDQQCKHKVILQYEHKKSKAASRKECYPSPLKPISSGWRISHGKLKFHPQKNKQESQLMTAITFNPNENSFTRLDEVIRSHVAQLPHYLQSEVYDFVLFLEQKQSINSEHIELTSEQQRKFVESLLNPTLANEKLQRSAQRYQQKSHE
jgi:uncharacterized protein (DUF1778 family)